MIWVIGHRGMLGSELCRHLQESGLPFSGTDREIDITDRGALDGFVRGKDLDWVINCAAYTAVDKAEEEPELCARLNVAGPENIARLCSSLGASMIHLSTDYVFDGQGERPYREEDPVNPRTVYGKTKAEGEAMVRACCDNAYVVRTAWLYARQGSNFVLTMLRLMKERDTIDVVSDQRGTPTFAEDLAHALVAMLRSDRGTFGTYHYSNLGETSWHEFALAIRDEARTAGILKKDCAVRPITSDQYPAKARRPAYSLLSKEKIMATFGISIPHWRESLHRCLGEERQP